MSTQCQLSEPFEAKELSIWNPAQQAVLQNGGRGMMSPRLQVNELVDSGSPGDPNLVGPATFTEDRTRQRKSAEPLGSINLGAHDPTGSHCSASTFESDRQYRYGMPSPRLRSHRSENLLEPHSKNGTTCDSRDLLLSARAARDQCEIFDCVHPATNECPVRLGNGAADRRLVGVFQRPGIAQQSMRHSDASNRLSRRGLRTPEEARARDGANLSDRTYRATPHPSRQSNAMRLSKYPRSGLVGVAAGVVGELDNRIGEVRVSNPSFGSPV